MGKDYFARLLSSPLEAKKEIDFIGNAYALLKKINDAYSRKQKIR